MGRTFDFARLGPPVGARVAVAGGCGGIGSAIVKGCVETDLDVTVLDLAATQEKNPVPDGVKFIPLDAHDEASIEAAFLELGKQGDHLDALINLIGGGDGASSKLVDLLVERLDRVLSLNLRSAFLMCRAAMSLLKASGAGAIVNTASAAAYRGLPNVGAYTAAKAGLIGITKTFATENAPVVRANVIAPGGVTNKVTVISKEDGNAIGPGNLQVGQVLKQIPLGRFADVEDMVGPALFLAGPMSEYMTGQVLHLSGGLLTP